MEKIYVRGGNTLQGTIKIDGAKNSALPILAASLLTSGPNLFEDVPALEDVNTICQLLEQLGVEVSWLKPGTLRIDAAHINTCETPLRTCAQDAGIFLVMGPSWPAMAGPGFLCLGCNIGTRPIDLHLKGFMALGRKWLWARLY